MTGEHNLSGSLGGLRIANPDDETSSPTIPSADYSQYETPIPTIHNQSYENYEQQDQNVYNVPHTMEYTGALDDSAYLANAYLRSRELEESGPVPARHPSSAGLQPRGSVSRRSNRPVSSLYQQQNGSASSGFSYREPQSRRNDGYSPQIQSTGILRSTSRSASNPANGSVPARSSSQRHSPFRPGQQFIPSNNGMIPPRRNSKRVPGHQPTNSQSSHMTTSSYVEGGPLASSEAWKEKGAAVTTRQEIGEDGQPISRIIKKGVKDFNFGRTLGEGSYSTVLAATDRQTGREYAIKVLDKRHIIKEKKVKYVNIEKDTLNRLTEHPGVVRLYYTFQDERSLYFVLDLAAGGELLGVLKRTGSFDEECTRFYGAQILDSVAYMHARGIIHRDLKPENVLLDETMHTKITDFGTAKILNLDNAASSGHDHAEGAGNPLDGADTDRAVSFVGTAEYVSPELLTDKNACKASDLWAFGCIIYQLLAGRPPFKASNEYQTFQKIVALDYHFPDGFPPVARDLIERLLVLDPSKRLPVEHIRAHPFFTGIQWGKSLWKAKAPRLKPYVPPPTMTMKPNGSETALTPTVPRISTNSPTPQPGGQPSSARPQLRSVTELPPPSQLDIDWSPVLTRSNERILKLGNLIVNSSPAALSPSGQAGNTSSDTPRKFSRFFGGATTKKKERLVMITSTARILVAAAGGNEKKVKLEISLSAPGVVYKSYQDSKGLTAFSVESVSSQRQAIVQG